MYYFFMLLTILSISFVISKPHTISEQKKIKIIETTNEYRKWAEELAKKSYSFYAVDARRANLQSSAPCGIESGSHKHKNGELRVIEVGEKLCLQIDDHGDTNLYLESIETDRVVLKYVHRFDHSSFGVMEKSVDSGLINLLFIAPSSQLAK